MHVIGADMPFQNGDIPAHAHLADQLTSALSHFASEHLVSILGDPHAMVLEIVDRVRPVAIVRYSLPFRGGGNNRNLLKRFA